MSAPNRPRNTTDSPSIDSGGEVIANRGRRGMTRDRQKKARQNFRRTLRYGVTPEELHLLAEVLAGRMTITEAGEALGVSYNNSGGAVASTMLRAARLGYYIRSDKGVPP